MRDQPKWSLSGGYFGVRVQLVNATPRLYDRRGGSCEGLSRADGARAVFGTLPARQGTATRTARDVEQALESLRPAHCTMPLDVGPGEGCSAELAGCLGTTRARSALASAKTRDTGSDAAGRGRERFR